MKSGGPTESSVSIFGDSIHLAASDLVGRFQSYSLEEYLAREARHGMGNYALVAQKAGRTKIITSPGYCGGYFYEGEQGVVAATTLKSILSSMGDNREMDPFALCFFLSYAPKNSFQSLPISSLFRGVRRLPPGCILEVSEGKVVSFYSYLTMAALLDPPASFEAALDEVTDNYAAYFARKGRDPAFMFSGGVDSLILHLGLRQKMDESRIKTFTMEFNRANGPERALPVAKKVGINTTVIPTAGMSSPETNAVLVDQMSKDIVTTKAPHLAFINYPIGETEVLHGQNMDAMANVNMTVTQKMLDRGFMAEVANEELLAKNSQTFLANMQFTEEYVRDEDFQRSSVLFYHGTVKNTIPDPQPGMGGLLRGMISSQYPNLLNISKHPLNQVEYLDREASLVKGLIGEKGMEPRYVLDMLRYYTYSHLANKRASTLPLPDGSRIVYCAMSGPITSYFLGRRRTLSQANQPKAEIYALAEKLSGMPYSDLIKGGAASPPDDADNEDSLVRENKSYLDVKESSVLPLVQHNGAKKYIEQIYKTVNSTWDHRAPKFSRYSQSRARQILNMEILLRSL